MGIMCERCKKDVERLVAEARHARKLERQWYHYAGRPGIFSRISKTLMKSARVKSAYCNAAR